MKSGYKKIQMFLVLALVLSVPLYFAFICYYSLSEADFLSVQLKFEAPDQINLSTVAKDKLKGFGSSSFTHLFFPDNRIFEQLPIISLQISPLDLTIFILRC
jgi:hypothetical protein